MADELQADLGENAQTSAFGPGDGESYTGPATTTASDYGVDPYGVDQYPQWVKEAFGLQQATSLASSVIGSGEPVDKLGKGNGGILDSMKSLWGGMTSDDKRAVVSAATLLAGGLAGMGQQAYKKRELDILQQRSDTDSARVQADIAFRNQQLANASAIGNTNFGSGMVFASPGFQQRTVNRPITSGVRG